VTRAQRASQSEVRARPIARVDGRERAVGAEQLADARIDAASRARRPVTRAPRSLDTVEDPGLAHLIDVLAHLERHAERLLERRVLERQQRLRPRDRLAYAGQLVELF
jgi:hypothetical protein